MVSMNGKMDKFIKVSGLMDLKVDQASGGDPKATLILANGKMAKLMDMEFTLGLMGTDTKANLCNVSNMVKASKNFLMEIFTRALT